MNRDANCKELHYVFGAKPKNTSCGFEPIRFVDRAELERRINDGTTD